MSRRMSLHDVRLPPNLLKNTSAERMGKLTEDEGAFLEFLDGLDLEDVRDWREEGKGEGGGGGGRGRGEGEGRGEGCIIHEVVLRQDESAIVMRAFV